MAIYRDLIAWQRAIDLADDVYHLTLTFPASERYALTQQICRAATSIPSNVAEGRGRGTAKEFCHFLRIARGSVYETETLLTLATRGRYLTEDQESAVLTKSERVLRLINGLIRKFERRPPTAD